MQKLINLETVQTLKSLGDPKLFISLVSVFSETGKRHVQNICHCADIPDWEKLSREAHSLKSSAGSLGADEMSALCVKLEKMPTNSEEILEARRLVKLLPDLYTRSLSELQLIAAT